MLEWQFVLQTARPMQTVAGQTIYEQDDAPARMFVAQSGTYRALCVAADGRRKARDYGPSDCFGACELLSQMGGRTCSIVVLTAGKLWAIPTHTVHMKLRVPPPLNIDGLAEFCRQVKLFQEIPPDRLVQLMRGAKQRVLKPDEYVFEEKSTARSIYALREGSLHTTQSDSDFSMKMLPPESFGESALFPDDELRVRRAAVIAGDEGAVVIEWQVAAIEILIGFELQSAR